ncbi:MAG: phosphatase PAP2 family protein [Acidobacteriota bacterium]
MTFCSYGTEEAAMNRLPVRPYLACMLAMCVVSPLRAQTVPNAASALLDGSTSNHEQVIQKPAGPAPTPRHTGIKALVKDLAADIAHLPSKENLLWVGVGGGLALAAHPADDHVNTTLVNSDLAHDVFKPGATLGQLPTLLSAATITYAVGRMKDQPKVSHLGMDLIQSLAISEALTQTLKRTTHRERPDGSGNNSFPSGHAADTFAFATALERHLGWKGAVPAYVFSSYVAISRLPANRHWLSDAVFGSAVGIIAGRTVTRHGRDFPLTLTVVPGGAALVYVRHSGP